MKACTLTEELPSSSPVAQPAMAPLVYLWREVDQRHRRGGNWRVNLFEKE